jgi:hypothetical protein
MDYVQALVNLEKSIEESNVACYARAKALNAKAVAEYDYAKSILEMVSEKARETWGENFIQARAVQRGWMPDGGGPEGCINVVVKNVDYDTYWDFFDDIYKHIWINVVDEHGNDHTYLEVKRNDFSNA